MKEKKEKAEKIGLNIMEALLKKTKPSLLKKGKEIESNNCFYLKKRSCF